MLRALLIRAVAVFIVVAGLLGFSEVFLRLQHYVKLDGFDHESPWNKVLHHGKGKFVVREYGSDCNGKKIKLLLLGDSWMEDEVLSNEIGQDLAQDSNRCVESVNGGNSSYAPTIYMLKAREAYEKYGQFDAIVVNIDETDIGDEWVRYRIPKVRDESGEVVAVPYGRDVHSEYLWNGKLWAEDSILYSVRLLKFAFYYKVLVPMFYQLTYREDYSTLMRYVFAPDARTKYKKAEQYFRDRLLEMTNELTGYTTAPGSVYVTHHPHRRGFVDQVRDGHRYLPIVSKDLAWLKKQTGVSVLDARRHIKEIQGDDLLTNTYQKGDPFSHLAPEGAVRYGRWIASQIDPEHG